MRAGCEAATGRGDISGRAEEGAALLALSGRGGGASSSIGTARTDLELVRRSPFDILPRQELPYWLPEGPARMEIDFRLSTANRIFLPTFARLESRIPYRIGTTYIGTCIQVLHVHVLHM